MFEVTGIGLFGDRGHDRTQRFLDRPQDADLKRATVAQRFRADVDLRDLRALGKELPIWKIGAQNEERVAIHHRLVSRGKAHETGHADIEWIIVFDVLLAAQRMHDRRLDPSGESDDLVMCACAARVAEQGDARAVIEERSLTRDLGFIRANDGLGRNNPLRNLGGKRLQRDIAGENDHRHAAFADSMGG